jgi:hypothetical protein
MRLLPLGRRARLPAALLGREVDHDGEVEGQPRAGKLIR